MPSLNGPYIFQSVVVNYYPCDAMLVQHEIWPCVRLSQARVLVETAAWITLVFGTEATRGLSCTVL